MSCDKPFVHHYAGSKRRDLHVNLHNKTFLWDDESKNDMKVLCNPHKKCGISHSLTQSYTCSCTCVAAPYAKLTTHLVIEQHMPWYRPHFARLESYLNGWLNSSHDDDNT